MDEQQKLYQAAGEIFFYSALLLKFSNEALEGRLRQHGSEITALQHGILNMLMFEKLTISVISQRLGMDASTLVRSVDRLERLGLVVRGRDPNDRRRNPLSITDKGRELIFTVPSLSYEDPTFKALQTLGIDNILQLRDLLRIIMNQFSEGKMIVEMMAGFSPPEQE